MCSNFQATVVSCHSGFQMMLLCLQAAKICNNMLLAVSMIGTAETMNLGLRYCSVDLVIAVGKQCSFNVRHIVCALQCHADIVQVHLGNRN